MYIVWTGGLGSPNLMLSSAHFQPCRYYWHTILHFVHLLCSRKYSLPCTVLLDGLTKILEISIHNMCWHACMHGDLVDLNIKLQSDCSSITLHNFITAIIQEVRSISHWIPRTQVDSTATNTYIPASLTLDMCMHDHRYLTNWTTGLYHWTGVLDSWTKWRL